MKDYNKIVDHNSININRITGPLLNYHKQGIRPRKGIPDTSI